MPTDSSAQGHAYVSDAKCFAQVRFEVSAKRLATILWSHPSGGKRVVPFMREGVVPVGWQRVRHGLQRHTANHCLEPRAPERCPVRPCGGSAAVAGRLCVARGHAVGVQASLARRAICAPLSGTLASSCRRAVGLAHAELRGSLPSRRCRKSSRSRSSGARSSRPQGPGGAWRRRAGPSFHVSRAPAPVGSCC